MSRSLFTVSPTRLRAAPLAGLLGALPLPFLPFLGGCQDEPEPAPLVDGDRVDEVAMRDLMGRFADEARLPGLSTCIFSADQVDWCGGTGVVDPAGSGLVTEDTAFLLASVSKVVTAAAAMTAVERGDLELDGDAATWADFALEHPDEGAFTPRQLLTHTAAIADAEVLDDYYTYAGDPEMSLDEVVRRYFDPNGADYDAEANFLDQAPGDGFEYSNIGSALAGWLVERASGAPFDTVTVQRIFDPLGMTDTSWWIADFAEGDLAMPSEWVGTEWQAFGQYSFADYPNGGLRSSARDLAQFGRMLLRGGELDGGRVLATTSVDAMTQTSVDDGEGGGVGLGWFTPTWLPDGWGGHDGGETGAMSALYLDRSAGVGVLYLANSEGEDDDALFDFEDTLLATAAALAE